LGRRRAIGGGWDGLGIYNWLGIIFLSFFFLLFAFEKRKRKKKRKKI
jgi:hypothetical protein